MCCNYSLDVLGVNVYATSNDDVFVAPQVVQVTILVHFAGVPCAEIPSFHGLVGEVGAFVVTAEAPIRMDLLAQRVARAHGFQRTGSKIQHRVQNLLGRRYKKTREGSHIFIWPRGTNPTEWNTFRTSEKPLSAGRLPIQELMAMAKHVCAAGHKGEAGIHQMANLLSLSRLRHKAKRRLMVALRKIEQ